MQENTQSGQQPLALIMKGGGVKGLAYAGAIKELSRRYKFNWYVGTSAGAIAAVLLAAGYSVDELEEILMAKDFRDFFDASRWRKWWNLIAHQGLYPAETLTNWIDSLLAQKLQKPTRVKLSDLPDRATVFASQRNQSVVCFDSQQTPDIDAAFAVRCSMSIPYLFTPQANQGFRTYDGGLQHNYPVRELLRMSPDTPFISLFLGPEVYEPVKQRWVWSDLLSIWTESGDAAALSEYKECTVIIDPRPIGTLDFSLTSDEKEYLLACGKAGALGLNAKETEEHKSALTSRNDLKAKVETAREAQRKAKVCRRWGCLTMILTTIFVYFFFFTGLQSFRGSMADYMDLRDESGSPGSSGRDSFFEQNAPRRVNWKGYTVLKSTTGYQIQPSEFDKRPAQVIFDGSVQRIPPGKYITFTGIVTGDVGVGVLSIKEGRSLQME